MKKKNETFSMMVILLIPVAIAINIVGGQMTSILKIPVDLDMIGVILVGALAGPLMLPLTVYLANELKKHGVRMKDNIITSDEMADQLQKIGKKE